MRKKFKMPDSFTILFILIILIGALTWIVPSGEYTYDCANGISSIDIAQDGTYVCPKSQEAADEITLAIAAEAEISPNLYTTESTYTYHATEKNSQGVWQVLMAPVNGFYEAVDICLFVLIIGGFINVVMKTGALDAGVGALLKKFNKREYLLIPILMILFGIGGTTYGMTEETIAFYLLIVPVLIIAGYDAVTGVMVILLGAGVGVLASTTNPFAIGVAASATGTSIGDGLISRFLLFIIVEAIAIVYTMRYAKRVKHDINNSIVADIHEQTKEELIGEKVDTPPLTRPRIVILALFAATFTIMVMSVIPWENFGINLFNNMSTFFNNNLPILVGSSGAPGLGYWWFGELTMLFMVGAIIIGWYANRHNILDGKFIDVFIEGCRDLLAVALIIGLSRGIKIVMSAGGMDATFLYYGSAALENLGQIPFIIGTYFFFIPMSFLIPSTSGLAGASMPVMGPLASAVYGSNEGIIYTITSFSAASGVVNLVTPTSGVVMGGLALARVPYDRWLKHMIPLMIILSVVICLFLAIGSWLNFVI